MKKIYSTRTTKKNNYFFFVFFIIFAFSFLGKALAAESMSLTATPVRLGDDFSISLSPGEKKQVQVKVRNGSSDKVALQSSAVDFVVADDGATPVAIEKVDSNNRWSLASWLTLAPAENKLASEEVATINVLIEVPKDALPGGHYAMIYHNPIDSIAVANQSSGSGISQRVGTLLYVMVKGPINEEAYISRFNWPKFLENGPVNFSLNIENQSDIHISTKPIMKVYNLFGKEVADIELESKNIFPKSERSFNGVWNKVWGLGYYKANIEAVYGNNGQVMSATASIIMFPVKIFLLIAIIILIVVIIFASIKRHKESSKSSSNSDSTLSSEVNPETKNEEPDESEKKD